MNNKEFSREVCFTFYEGWLEQAEQIREIYNDTVALEYIFGVAKYALYEEEPQDPIIKMIISGFIKQIDASQKRRARGFNGENTEQTEIVLKYHEEHPEASQNNIAKATGISKGKVNSVLKKYRDNTNNDSISNTNSNTYTSSNTSTTVTMTDKIDLPEDEDDTFSFLDQIDEKHPEIALEIINNWNGNKLPDIAKIVNNKLGCNISVDDVKYVINKCKDNSKTYKSNLKSKISENNKKDYEQQYEDYKKKQEFEINKAHIVSEAFAKYGISIDSEIVADVYKYDVIEGNSGCWTWNMDILVSFINKYGDMYAGKSGETALHNLLSDMEQELLSHEDNYIDRKYENFKKQCNN